MESRFIIFRFVLIYLLAISVAGCASDNRDDDPETPMDKLTGEYVLVELKYRITDTTISIETPTVLGKLMLGTEGINLSLTVVITDDVSLISDNQKTLLDPWKVDEGSWVADETDFTMSVKDHSNNTVFRNVFKYKYDEKYLTLEGYNADVMITMKWQKL